MIIKAKVLRNGDPVGYKIDDSGVEYYVTERGLYDNDIIKGLSNQGYQFMNYHGDILTPDGIAIRDLVTEEFTGSEEEYQAMLDMEDLALTEAEAASYFSRTVDVKEVELRASTDEIKTREEFLAYIDRFRRMNRMRTGQQDIRPINSFVAREALFTMEEVAQNADVREALRVLGWRRRFDDFKSYDTLRTYLYDCDLLASRNANCDEVVTAYLAWGIDGIKTPIIGIRAKVGVSASIINRIEGVESGDSMSGKITELGLVDKRGAVYCSKGMVDLSSLDSFEREDVAPVNETSYFDTLNVSNTWGAPYAAIKLNVTDYITRHYYELLDENGVTYQIKADPDNFAFFDNRNCIFYVGGWFVNMLSGGAFSIRVVGDEKSYTRKNLLMAKALDFIKDSTYNPPVNSSLEMCISEGVTPEAAIRYLARCVSERPDLNGGFEDGVDFSRAHIVYRDGPDDGLVRKYNPNGDEYANIDQLIEIMSATKEDMVDKGDYLRYDKNAFDAESSAVAEEAKMRPIENLEFVYGLKYNDMAINHIAQGRNSDGSAELNMLAIFIGTCVDRLTEGKEVSYADYANCVSRVSDGEVVDMGKAVRRRYATYYGYLKDRASLNATRATQSTSLVYVTKVFREMSNAPVDSQRHYMFECVTIPVEARSREEADLHLITDIIRKATKNLFSDYRLDEVFQIEAPAIAARTMFKIMAKVPNFVSSQNSTTVTLIEKYRSDKVGEEKEVEFVLPREVYDRYAYGPYLTPKYCTLYDWAVYEMSPNAAFNLYCVNANISPWYVTPKKGFNINEFNFGVNYVRNEALTSLSEAFRTGLAQAGGKVTELCKWYLTASLLAGDILDEAVEYDINSIGIVLDEQVDESPARYFDRFTLLNKDANTRSMVLYKMRLKSDVIYDCYADIFELAVPDEDEYSSINAPADKSQWLATYNVAALSQAGKSIQKCISSGGNSVTKFDVTDYRFEDIMRWSSLVNGTYVPTGLCLSSGTKVIFVSPNGNQVKKDLSTITREQADTLTEKGYMYKLDGTNYLIYTSAGKYVVEVV